MLHHMKFMHKWSRIALIQTPFLLWLRGLAFHSIHAWHVNRCEAVLTNAMRDYTRMIRRMEKKAFKILHRFIIQDRAEVYHRLVALWRVESLKDVLFQGYKKKLGSLRRLKQVFEDCVANTLRSVVKTLRLRRRISSLIHRINAHVSSLGAVYDWREQWLEWSRLKAIEDARLAEEARVARLIERAIRELQAIARGWEGNLLRDILGRWIERAEGYWERLMETEVAAEAERERIAMEKEEACMMAVKAIWDEVLENWGKEVDRNEKIRVEEVRFAAEEAERERLRLAAIDSDTSEEEGMMGDRALQEGRRVTARMKRRNKVMNLLKSGLQTKHRSVEQLERALRKGRRLVVKCRQHEEAGYTKWDAGVHLPEMIRGLDARLREERKKPLPRHRPASAKMASIPTYQEQLERSVNRTLIGKLKREGLLSPSKSPSTVEDLDLVGSTSPTPAPTGSRSAQLPPVSPVVGRWMRPGTPQIHGNDGKSTSSRGLGSSPRPNQPSERESATSSRLLPSLRPSTASPARSPSKAFPPRNEDSGSSSDMEDYV